MKHSSKNNKGFTIVELIIVIAIIAVLSATLLPQYLKFIEESEQTSDLSIANTIVDAATLAIISPSTSIPPGYYIEVLWTAGADAQKNNYEGLVLVRTPMRSSSFNSRSDLLPLKDDALIKEYAQSLISLLGETALPATGHGNLSTGYVSFVGYPKSNLAKEAALGFHINTTTGEVVLATWSGNGDVNKWLELGLAVGKAE